MKAALVSLLFLLALSQQAISFGIVVTRRPRTASVDSFPGSRSLAGSRLWSTSSANSRNSEEKDGVGVTSVVVGDDLVELSYPPEQDVDNKLSLWQRRLITREDPFGIHKISSIVYSISALVILGTGAVRLFQSPDIFAEIPSSLELPTYAFCLSNLVMCAASVRMAFLHRRYDLTARNAFLVTAVSSLFSGFFFLWTSPFGPEILNNDGVNKSCFAAFVLLNVVFIMDTLLKVPEVVESRRDRKAEDYRGRFWADALAYVLPIAWGLPPVLGTAYIQAFLHDRPWFFEQCLYIDQVRGVPGMEPNLCYLQVAASVAASYGSLFVTLRDKKLISKNQEIFGITIFSVPAMIWTIYGSALFIMNAQW